MHQPVTQTLDLIRARHLWFLTNRRGPRNGFPILDSSLLVWRDILLTILTYWLQCVIIMSVIIRAYHNLLWLPACEMCSSKFIQLYIGVSNCILRENVVPINNVFIGFYYCLKMAVMRKLKPLGSLWFLSVRCLWTLSWTIPLLLHCSKTSCSIYRRFYIIRISYHCIVRQDWIILIE